MISTKKRSNRLKASQDDYNSFAGWIFINEEVSPVEQTVKNLEVYDKNSIFYVEFDTCLHSFEVMNRNSRMYTGNNVLDCINSEKIQWFLTHRGWFGEQNHPISYYTDKKLSSERMLDIKMDNTSHKIMNPHIKGNMLLAKLQTDSGCDAGMNLARKMIQGLIPGFSCRAVGKLELIDGKPTVVIKILVTYDWVLYPSHKEAIMLPTGKGNFINKTPANQIWINESTAIDVNNHSPSICCDLKSMLKDIYRTDDKIKVILETFELTDDDLFDITEDGNQVMIKDKNNIIFSNVEFQTKKRIDDFMRSVDIH